jgi:hypothetical protein
MVFSRPSDTRYANGVNGVKMSFVRGYHQPATLFTVVAANAVSPYSGQCTLFVWEAAKGETKLKLQNRDGLY